MLQLVQEVSHKMVSLRHAFRVLRRTYLFLLLDVHL